MAYNFLDITSARMAFYHLLNAVLDHHYGADPANSNVHDKFWSGIDPKSLKLIGMLNDLSIDNMDDDQAMMNLCVLYSLILNTNDGNLIFPIDRDCHLNMASDNYQLLAACGEFLPSFMVPTY